MGGYVFIYGFCIGCGRPFSYNPNYVPSLRVDGRREAICASCHAAWNEIHRVSKDLDPIPLHPNAYEPEPEENC